MSDYLFMLESHLSPSQREAVAAVEAVGAEAESQTFLVGGALRDMLGGYPITDLDFAVQGNAMAIAKTVAKRTGAEIVDTDSHYKSAELRFRSGVTAEIGMARTETFGKAGARPKVVPSGIHEDLMRRDFTMNSIALSLHPASRGLLLDPCNGAADIELREIRAHGNYGFYDDPVRMLRMVRLQVRLGFEVDPRTQRQFDNAKEAGMESHIPARALFREMRSVANELNLCSVMSSLASHGFMDLVSPALKKSNLNLSALGKLEKAKQMIPYGINLNLDPLGLFFFYLTEKLTSRERTALVKTLKMQATEVELWKKLESRSHKLERELKSTKLHRTSDLYYRLLANPGDELLFLFLQSKERLVHDRIRSFLQKHLYTVIEVTDRDVTTLSGVEPGETNFAKFREEIIVSRLDGRKWKPPVVKAPKPEKPVKQAKRKASAGSASAAKIRQKLAASQKAPAGKTGVDKETTKNAGASGAVAKPAAAKKAAAKKAARKKADASGAVAGKVSAKKIAPKKAAAKGAAAGKGAAQKAVARKTASKSAAKKAVAKKTASKSAAKQAVAKKTASKSAAKKAVAKKTTSKSAAKKAVAKKTASKSAAPKKVAAKKAAKKATPGKAQRRSPKKR